MVAVTHSLRTRLVAAGRSHVPDAPVNPPVDFTSTYRYAPGVEPGGATPRSYAREGIPSFDPLESLLAELEGGEHALLFSSGLSAASAVLHQLPVGSHLALPHHAYMGLSVMAQQLADRGVLTLHRVDISDTQETAAAVQHAAESARAAGTQCMLWVESPTNPMLEVAELPEVISSAKRAGAWVAVDNTFATPLRQTPLADGADVVVHSVTKFIAGHSDVIMGATVTSDPQLQRALTEHRTLHGAIPGPMEVFLALRGVRTLAVRLDAAETTAGYLAQRLEELADAGHIPVHQVRYPGLASHPHHARAAQQFSGFGAIVTIDMGSAAAADAVLDQVRVWTPATSLGGVESLAERRRRHGTEPPSVPEGLIRLSVGIEAADDLLEDLVLAMGAASSSVS